MRKNQIKKRGSSTLEIMIAMMILFSALTAALLVSSGNQSLLTDSEINAEALTLAQRALENAQALARRDFKLVNSNTTSETIGAVTYTKRINVTTEADFFTKKVVAEISWPGTYGRNPKIFLTALVTNFENASGGDTCDSNIADPDSWRSPEIKNSDTDFASLAGVSGTYPITDIDAYENKLYVTTNHVGASQNQNTFFVFNILSGGNNLVIENRIDNDIAPGHYGGLNAVTVDGKYAYVANASDISVGQFQIIDLGSMSVVKTIKVPSVLGPKGVGKSVFYRNGYVYLGLESTEGNGPEFHIIDVHDPLSASVVGSWPDVSLNSDINDILLKDGYAYLATSNEQELMILDISDPLHPVAAGPSSSYDATGDEYGKSLYSFGDTIYLGRMNSSSGAEFYILDSTNPINFAALNPAPAVIETNSDIGGVIFRAGRDNSGSDISRSLAFLLSEENFEVWDTDDLSPWTQNGNTSQFLNLPGVGSSAFKPVMDCEGNKFFVGSSDTDDRGSIYLIAP